MLSALGIAFLDKNGKPIARGAEGLSSLDRIDIVGDVADNVPRGMGVEIAYRKLGQMVKHLLSHGVDDLFGQDHHKKILARKFPNHNA